MPRKNVHILPREGNWVVKKEGNERATKITHTQKEAVDAGREIAKKQGLELIVHRKDGQIRSKDSYGSDPNPPKDKEH